MSLTNRIKLLTSRTGKYGKPFRVEILFLLAANTYMKFRGKLRNLCICDEEISCIKVTTYLQSRLTCHRKRLQLILSNRKKLQKRRGLWRRIHFKHLKLESSLIISKADTAFQSCTSKLGSCGRLASDVI